MKLDVAPAAETDVPDAIKTDTSPTASVQTVTLPPKGGRTFSKRLVIACVGLAWVALFYAIFAGLDTVAVAGFTFIAGIGGAYMGVGHLDLRQLLSALGSQPPPPPDNFAG